MSSTRVLNSELYFEAVELSCAPRLLGGVLCTMIGPRVEAHARYFYFVTAARRCIPNANIPSTNDVQTLCAERSYSEQYSDIQIPYCLTIMRSTAKVPIRLLTHNIRYATPSPSKGEELWSARKTGVVNELRFNTAHNAESFICLQEVLHEQLLDVCFGLNHASVSVPSDDQVEWAYIGVGRDDGHQAGEYSPIFYRPAVWELLECRTVWLSKTPWKPSKSWDAASIRIVTIGVFKHRDSRKHVMAMNTHLDDQGAESRLEAAKIILHQIDDYTNSRWKDKLAGVFLAGDLNSRPDGEAYRLLNSEDSSVADFRDSVPPERRYGHEYTFSGFGDKPLHRIDFLHLGLRKSSKVTESSAGDEPSFPTWTAQGYAVLENRFDDGIYISDHRAVVGDVLLS